MKGDLIAVGDWLKGKPGRYFIRDDEMGVLLWAWSYW